MKQRRNQDDRVVYIELRHLKMTVSGIHQTQDLFTNKLSLTLQNYSYSTTKTKRFACSTLQFYQDNLLR